MISSEKQLTLNKKSVDSFLNRLVKIGLIMRYRVLIQNESLDVFEPYAIPGYGLTVNGRVFAINVFLKINLLKI